MWRYTNTNELYHHGVKGMKWGVRRYQNEDGSLTDEGQKRYVNGIKKTSKAWYGERQFGKITDDIGDDLDRQPAFKKQLKKLSDLTDKAVELERNAYEIKDAKRRGKKLEEAEKAYDEYYKERDKMVDSLVGKYGDKKITTYVGGIRIVSTGRAFTEEAIMKRSGWHTV